MADSEKCDCDCDVCEQMAELMKSIVARLDTLEEEVDEQKKEVKKGCIML